MHLLCGVVWSEVSETVQTVRLFVLSVHMLVQNYSRARATTGSAAEGKKKAAVRRARAPLSARVLPPAQVHHKLTRPAYLLHRSGTVRAKRQEEEKEEKNPNSSTQTLKPAHARAHKRTRGASRSYAYLSYFSPLFSFWLLLFMSLKLARALSRSTSLLNLKSSRAAT